MEIEFESQKLHDLNWKAEPPQPYESEVFEIRQRRGDLEEIRRQLGLSKKRISELLLVDPSAWTRWTRGISRVPAHVYRSLDWYLSLLEKDPKLREKQKVDRIEKELAAGREQLQSQLEALKSELHSENWREERRKLLSQLESAEKLSFAWKALLLVTFLLALL
jgi:transcriptional regulator with XRE-family HTH domain